MKMHLSRRGPLSVRGAIFVTSLALFGCSTPTTEPTADQTVAVEEDAAAITSVPAKPADGFVNSIGINTKLTYTQSVYSSGFYSIVKPKLLALGVRHLRDEGQTVRSDGWMGLIYGRMKELASRGIKFNLIMRPAEGVTDFTRIYEWEKFLKYALPVVEDLEGLNEWDLKGRTSGWASQVKSFQKALWLKAKADARTKNLPIFAPTMGNPANATYVGNLASYLNYGNTHPYPGGAQPMARISAHESLVRTISGSRAWVVTETGYHNALGWTGGHPPVSESASARYLSRLWLEYYRLGIRRSYVTELIDLGSSSTNRELSFGLLRNNGSAKPAYAALQNLITIHKDPGPAFNPGPLSYGLSGSLTNVQQLLLQKRTGVFYLNLWLATNSWNLSTKRDIFPAAQNVTVSFPANVRQIRVFNPISGVSSIKTVTGVRSITVAVKDSPTVVEVTR